MSWWAFLIGVFAFLYYYDYLSLVFTVGGYLSAILVGLTIGIYAALLTSKKHVPKIVVEEPLCKVLKELMNISQAKADQAATLKQQRSPIFTRNIDVAIEEVLDFTLRDFILSWLQPLISDHKVITDGIKDDIWFSFQSLKERLSKIDEVKFITQDVANKLCHHFQCIRQASCSNGKDKKTTFLLRPYLASEEKELEFLRKFSEVVLILLAPATYAQSIPVRHLIREVLTCSVLYPTINMLCDPDYINQKLLGYLQYHQEMLEQHKRTYTYAATYEGFIKMIHERNDIEQLQRVRYNIMTEIMHATTINNLKKSKGIDLEREFISQGNAKGDLLQARNLRRYIKQITLAKSICEKRLKSLGGPDYLMNYCQVNMAAAEATDDDQSGPENKVLPYSVLMGSDFARSFLIKFLSREDCQFLLEFYIAVEELKLCDKTKLHQLASEVFHVYITYVSAVVKIDRGILKRMESFLIGNKGPEAFFEAQDEVYKFLEERYYPSFIVSDLYQMMMLEADRVGVEFQQDTVDIGETDVLVSEEASTHGNSTNILPLSDHSSVAKFKLEQLDDKLTNKMQASEAMKISQMGDDKILKMLEREIECMKDEKRQLILHIERTEAWAENLGGWKVSVAGVEMVEDKDNKTIPFFLLFVHLDGDATSPCEDEEDEEELPINSWIVKRRANDFVELSQKLAQIGAWVRNVELPRENKLRSKGTDSSFLDTASTMLQKFLDLVLQDDTMNKSEALYGFLSPSPEHLKHFIPSPKKSKFFFSTLFKSNQSSSQGEGSDDDELLFFDDIDSPLKDDRIAEPLYNLMGEIFEMRSFFMLLRRTLVSFVQIKFGRTINKQLRETLSWVFSESMVVYYIHLFRDSMWPQGKIYAPVAPRSDEEKLQTRYRAKDQLLNSIPDMMNSLLGQQNAKKGARKVFESLQDARLNKQIAYELLEMLILELFPEIRK